MSAIPASFLSLGVGVIVDRVLRRKFILITQICAMLLACLLAAHVFAGAVQPWHILVPVVIGFGAVILLLFGLLLWRVPRLRHMT